jgi:hypothetical protein
MREGPFDPTLSSGAYWPQHWITPDAFRDIPPEAVNAFFVSLGSTLSRTWEAIVSAVSSAWEAIVSGRGQRRASDSKQTRAYYRVYARGRQRQKARVHAHSRRGYRRGR